MLQEEKAGLIFNGRVVLRVNERKLTTDDLKPNDDETNTLIPYSIKPTSFREKDTPIDEIQKLNLYAEFKIPVNVVAGTGNTIKVKKTTLQNTNKFNEYLKKDGITIYFASNIEEVYLNLFYRDISNMTLKYYIENINEPIKDAIKDITQYLNREEIYKDGGSTVYRSKEYDITLVKCNNMSGNKDVYIGDYNLNTDGITMCSR